MFRMLCAVLTAAFLASSVPAEAQLPKPEELKEMKGKLKMSIRSGLRFLQGKFDPKTGSWGHPGIDALVLLAIVRSPDGPRYDDSDPFIRGPIDSLMARQKKNGQIDFQGMLANYVTSVSLLAFCEVRERKMIKDAERAKKLDATIASATKFLKVLQADEGEGYKPGDKMYGGVGYGGDMRPDLSNTQLALEAAKKAGLPKDDPFFKKAIKFLERTQNRSESNDQKDWPSDDGGFVYYPGKTYAKKYKKADGKEGLQSYGSMTYAGIKSYIYAGLDWKDPRVKAAMGWIKGNYTVKTHPNAGNLGLFYYYHTFAKTMALVSEHTGTNVFVDVEGQKHHWGYDLAKELMSRQHKEEGWWKNSNGKWMESQEVLATTYAILALNYAYPLKMDVKKADAPAKDAPKKDPTPPKKK